MNVPLWKFEVRENGQFVAGGNALSHEEAMREAAHYASAYAEDGGKVEAVVWAGRRPKFDRLVAKFTAGNRH